jgi:hypothetical protein
MLTAAFSMAPAVKFPLNQSRATKVYPIVKTKIRLL